MLEKIKLETKTSLGFIRFTSKELSAICPVNQKPDRYDLEIEFTPKEYTLEVGTLRDFVLSFQDQVIFAENLVGKISTRLFEVLEPSYLSVKLSRSEPESGIGIEVFQQLGWEKKL